MVALFGLSCFEPGKLGWAFSYAESTTTSSLVRLSFRNISLNPRCTTKVYCPFLVVYGQKSMESIGVHTVESGWEKHVYNGWDVKSGVVIV